MKREGVPKHIAIIMDGNGRWAKQRSLPRMAGHRAGARAVKEAIQGCLELGVEILSLFTFSTENWQRPRQEVQALMRLLERSLKENLPTLKKNRIRLLISGSLQDLPRSLQRQIQKAIVQTEGNSRLILNLALNYGGRQDILQAAKNLAVRVKQGRLRLEEIDQKVFASLLYTGELPDPDLVIRTSGEQRVSNFFLWQISYSEFYFTPVLWPDFKKEDLFTAVSVYQRRERRFGAYNRN